MAVASVKVDFITGPAAAAAAKLRAKTDQLAKSMHKFQRVSDTAWTKFGNKVRKTRRVVQVNMEKMKRAIGGLNLGSLVAGAGLGFFAKNAIQTAGKAQALEVRMKLLTEQYGEYDKAQAIASRASKTFGMSNIEAAESVTNIIGRLRPLGVSMEDIETTFFGFNTAATTAGVSAAEASGAFRQLAQALGSGRLQGDEFRSLAEQVPTLLKPIADELGTTVGGLKELGSQGKITSDVVIRALKTIEREGGGAVEAIVSKSALQRFKEFQNAMEDLSRAVGDELMPAITPLVKLMTRLVKAASELNPVIKRAAIVITALAAGLLIVAPAVVSLVGGMALLLPVFKGVAIAAGILTAKFWLIAAAIAAVIAGLTWLGNKFLNWRKDQKDWNTLLKEGTEKSLQSALAIEKETLARINNGEIMDGNATKVEKRIKQLEEELGLREKLAESLITDADREDIRKENELDSFLSSKIDKSLGGTRPPVEDAKEYVGVLDVIKEKWGQITDIVASGMTDAVMGLIDGTKTLGESLAGIAKSLARMFLNSAFSTMIGNIFPTAAEGAHWRGGFKAFAGGGLVTRPTIGLVGEAGEDEYIIPASKMSGAMDRYSAGARGQAVIPGGGTVASGSGVSSSPTVVNYTGPVLSFNSEAYVPKSAIPEIINSAARRGAQEGESKVMGQLKNSRSQRSKLGL